MPNLIELAATALLVHTNIPLPEATNTVEVQSWNDDPSTVHIHLSGSVLGWEVVAIAKAIDADTTSVLTTDTATMAGDIGDGKDHEVTVYYPVTLIDQVSRDANIIIEE